MASWWLTDNQTLIELSQYTHGVGLADLKKWNYEEKVDVFIQDRIESHEVHLLHSKAKRRHFKLKRLVSAPYMITAIGDVGLLDQSLLWVVWPRKISIYAQEILTDIFESIKRYSLVTISGGAMWVDSICHHKSIEQWTPTIMVLGEWLRRAMLGAKRDMIRQVVEAWWLVLSEFPLDMPAAKRSFPQRNRIVAGMSEMLFVPAAGKKSWSLISVDFALKMHIPVYTVPWSLYDATSAGTNEYLSNWFIYGVTEFDSMLEKYFIKKYVKWSPSAISVSLTEQQQELLTRLPATKNILMKQWVSLADLMMLEIGGHITMNEWGELVRKK
jgi:DNA processing protein